MRLHGVRVCIAQDVVQCVVRCQLSCPVVCGFCVWGAALGIARKDSAPSERAHYPTQWHSWLVGRGGGGRFESRRLRATCVSFVYHCACTCRACCVPHLKLNVRLHGVRVCTAQDVVQCVVRCLLSCPVVCGFCVWGAALGFARKDSAPPCPKGRFPASRHTRHFSRPSGRPCRRGPGLFVLPSPHSVDRVGVGRQSTHARLLPC